MSNNRAESNSEVKLGEVTRLLRQTNKSSLPFQCENADFLSTSVIAKKLFARLPARHLNTKTSSDLVHITETSSQQIELVLKNRERHFVHHEVHETHTSFYIAQGDKPFIINSITELFRNSTVTVKFLLHPLFMHEGFRLSLIYLECERLSNEQLQLIGHQLEQTLADLAHATADYTAMLSKSEALARIIGTQRLVTSAQHEQDEVAEFIKWLCDGGYIYLGYLCWSIKGQQVVTQPTEQLGILKSSNPHQVTLLKESIADATSLIDINQLIYVSKLSVVSQIQRHNRLSAISVIEYSPAGEPLYVHSFIGLFTSKALAQESSSIPLIRHKLKLVAQAEELYENSFDYKNTVNIIDSMPKDEAIRIDLESLRDVIRTILSIQSKNETCVSVRFDNAQRGIFALVVIPRDRFNGKIKDRLQAHLEKTFCASPGNSEYHLDLTNKPFARLYFYIPLPHGNLPDFDLSQLEQDVTKLSQTWSNYLEEQILNSVQPLGNVADILNRYGNAFPDDYQALCTTSDALADITVLENIFSSNKNFAFAYRELANSSNNVFNLILYYLEQPVTLSKTLPIFEKLGLEVITESCLQVSALRQKTVFIHRYKVRPLHATTVDAAIFHDLLEPALTAIFLAEVENDQLNSLILNAKLSYQEVVVLRAYCNLLWQVSTFATRESMYSCLANNPKLAQLLWKIFDLSFNPSLTHSIDQRQTIVKKLREEYNELLHNVQDINEDRILRALENLLQHSVRTNFYLNLECLAIKLHSRVIDIIPQPRPLYEIFVYSVNLQGTHLRMSKVARGGIRWSERHDDFRSEVLGLVKTQNVKNAVIVPAGAKGGFIVRNLPVNDNAELKVQVQAGYSSYIRALLSLADNLKDGDPITPTGLICHDQSDPYFVVAADKGTATFSDTANKIAVNEFKFWLDDAFASGGSQGYDHKLYGITAKGAWECVLRHFCDLGINYEKEPFDVIGIGDMSGDVFGNGLLLSNNIRLLAAFNHKHIFVDPNPDPLKSFSERKRLFELPGSQWSDYNQDLISKGGGIFSRFDKRIKLTPEIKKILQQSNISTEHLNGEELIHLLLQTPCHLLWNGGIGTYVKGVSQSNADVQDSTNDRVRVNSNQLRAKVIGEGGNLGFTQVARIEFAELGGRINTDAIDNSAGVDLSDHEVNIKILLSQAEKQGLLSRVDRDSLLKEIAPEVVTHVLSHNINHATALTFGVQRSQRNIAFFRSLIQELQRLNYINRTIENLPDDEKLRERARNKQGLTRPELAVCLAGVKMYLKDVVSDSDICSDPCIQPFLSNYFPLAINQRFADLVATHPLRNNIIATQITNSLVDTMGITFVHRVSSTNSVPASTVVRCAVAAKLILNSSTLLTQIEQFNNFTNTATYISLRREINTALRHVTSWFLLHHVNQSIADLVAAYKTAFTELGSTLDRLFSESNTTIFKARVDNYSRHGLPADLATQIAALVLVEDMLEVIWIARKTGSNYQNVACVLNCVQESLGIGTVLKLANQLSSPDKLETELLLATVQDIRRSVSVTVERIVNLGIETSSSVHQHLEQISLVADLKKMQLDLVDNTTVAGMAIYAKRLANLAGSLG